MNTNSISPYKYADRPQVLAERFESSENALQQAKTRLVEAKKEYDTARKNLDDVKEILGQLVGPGKRQAFLINNGRILKIEYRKDKRNSVVWANTIS